MSRVSPPRIYCIPASDAPVVAVLRRGPTEWAHVGRWDLENRRYEPGAWLHGRIFPRRSDLSPDGRHLCTFVHQPGADWEHGETYILLSRLPWLTALHASRTDGTWTRGWHFTAERGGDDPELAELPLRYGLRVTRPIQFATERRRGWEETEDSPPRDAADTWDERRNVRLRKRQPGGDHVLCVESVGQAGGEFGKGQAIDGLRLRYSLEDADDIALLDDVQWADWDREGRLLVATRDGRLQIRGADARSIAFEENLSGLKPDPAPAPDWAGEW
ncbi:MAG TPA: hypothetical protein VKU85_07975 [bacterium]|nr:hypothetical protein [bacterium]